MGPILLLLLLQSGVFTDRDAGCAVDLPLGWQLTYAGTEGRLVLKRTDEPSTFVRIDPAAEKNEEAGKGNWDPFLERFKTNMLASQPGISFQRHEVSAKDGLRVLEVWYSSGDAKEPVTGFFRALATPERLWTQSAAVSKAKWEAMRESIETTLRTAVLLKSEPGAGGVWTDRQNEYSIAVPAGYLVRPQKRGNVVLNLLPIDGGGNMNVVVKEPESFEAPKEEIRATLEAQLKDYPGFTYLDFEKVTWEGRPAIKTAATLIHRDVKIANMQFAVSTKVRSYFLTWTCRESIFKIERPNFESSLKTFKVHALK